MELPAMDPQSRAMTYLADSKFHRSFKLQPTTTNGLAKPLRITYSDVGDPDSSKTPILYCLPAFGGRYIATYIDAAARRKGVRVICCDRFGMGGTEMVPLDMRVIVWLEVVPRLLEHLSIRKIALVGHSIGAVYLLNIILQHRDLLDDQQPLAVLLSPWVQAAQSGSYLMTATSYLPKALVSKFHNILPSMIHAGKSFDTAWNFSSGIAFPQNSSATFSFEKAVQDLMIEYATHEDLTGASQEAMFALQKAGSWGWDAYPDVIETLAKNEKGRPPETKKLKVKCFWGEKDRMIPMKGRDWFDKQWNGQSVIEYESQTVAKADHDNIFNQTEIMEWILNQL